MNEGLSYSKSGINIDDTDDVKRQIRDSVDSDDDRVLNKMGAL